jgi:hypothetical protein
MDFWDETLCSLVDWFWRNQKIVILIITLMKVVNLQGRMWGTKLVQKSRNCFMEVMFMTNLVGSSKKSEKQQK